MGCPVLLRVYLLAGNSLTKPLYYTAISAPATWHFCRYVLLWKKLGYCVLDEPRVPLSNLRLFSHAQVWAFISAQILQNSDLVAQTL